MVVEISLNHSVLRPSAVDSKTSGRQRLGIRAVPWLWQWSQADLVDDMIDSRYMHSIIIVDIC